MNITGKKENTQQKKHDWKKFEKNDLTIDLNVLCTKNEKIYPAYASKHKANRENEDLFFL